MGGGQPIGFGVGLILGGVLTGTVGWQWGFFVAAIVNFLALLLAVWYLPRNLENLPPVSLKRLVSDIDWFGATIASSSLAMMSYFLAYLKHYTFQKNDTVNSATDPSLARPRRYVLPQTCLCW